jgi:branched-chain amino acid transport system ATP-binding protein
MLKAKDIHTYYGDSHILQGVTIEVSHRQCVALVGRNGAGKTTTLRTILGYVAAKRGQIYFDGKDITRLPTWRIVRLGIGIVPEDRGIFSSLTVEEHLRLAYYMARFGPARRSMEDIFLLFPRLAERRRSLGNQLSGGEQQMLAIGRALIARPELLILDEPSEGLAPLIVERLIEILRKIRDEGTTILLVEQNYYMAIRLANYVYVLSQGQVKFEGRSAELEASPQIKHEFLGV